MENIVTESRVEHGDVSYYRSDKKLPIEIQKAIGQDILISSNDELKPINLDLPNVPKKKIYKELTKYDHYNGDGLWYKIRIDITQIPAYETITRDYIKHSFTDRTLEFIVIKPESSDEYFFKIETTVHAIMPDECKYVINKGKLIISLLKKVKLVIQDDKEWFDLRKKL